MSGVLGRLSWPVAAIEHVGLVPGSARQPQPPGPAVLVEGGGEDLGAEADVPEHVEVAGDVA